MQGLTRFHVETYSVLGVDVALVKLSQATELINSFVRATDRTRLVTFTNVHMVVEAKLHPKFQRAMDHMDVNFPDGAPIFWLGHLAFGARASKISGPDFMPEFCRQSVPLGHRHFLFGGAPGVAETAAHVLENQYPGIRIVGYDSPPFRADSQVESLETIDRINASGADIIWVCLGCPKQELWMTENRHLLKAKVVLAVGQAFDVMAGRTQRAPQWIRDNGLEWAYRLVQNPQRLWKRYLITNFLFLYWLALSVVQGKMRIGHQTATAPVSVSAVAPMATARAFEQDARTEREAA